MPYAAVSAARKTAYRQFHHAVVAQQVAVVGILIAGRYLQHTLGDEVGHRVSDVVWITPVMYLA